MTLKLVLIILMNCCLGNPYDVNSYRLKDTLFDAHLATDYTRELLSSLYDKEFEKVLSDE